jgi:hypothetical protein
MGRSNTIDLFRFIGTLSVLILHTDFGKLPTFIVDDLRLLSRWAVPFFFMVSGFFLSKHIQERISLNSNIVERLMRLLTILIISSLFFTPIALYLNHYPFQVSNLITGTYFHLWFIGSLIWSTVVIWYVYYLNKEAFLPLLSGILLATAVFANSYDLLFSIDIDYYFFMFLSSLPFIFIGILFREKRFYLQKTSVLITLLVFGIAIQKTEAIFFESFFRKPQYEQQLLLGTIIISLAIFGLSISHLTKENIISKLGRDHSLFIYLFHPIFYLLIDFIYRLLPFQFVYELKMFNPIYCLLLTLLASAIIKINFPTFFNLLNGEIK